MTNAILSYAYITRAIFLRISYIVAILTDIVIKLTYVPLVRFANIMFHQLV
jgi:hypothetical protein